MNDTLKWGVNEFAAGDRLSSVFDHRVIVITDIYLSNDEFSGISVALEIGDSLQRVMDADEFAYRVDQGHMMRLPGSLFEVGQSFTHHANNDTIEVLSISERPDWKGEYKYFVRMVNENGHPSFTTVDELYLGRCLAFVSTTGNVFVLPEIQVDAVFPDATLV